MTKNKKKIQKTPEELQWEYVERMKKQIEEDLHLISEPTYILGIGTPVRVGNLRDPIIEEILFDGKAYLIDYTDYNHNHGDPILTPNSKKVFRWVDVRKTVLDNTPQFYKQEELKLSYSQRSMDGILGMYYHFGVDLDPEYQREHVWTLEDKVKLVDSIFNHVDIGKFVFVHLGYHGKHIYEILDGKQRYRALLDFFEDRFQYNGLYYSDMCNRDQTHFDNYAISYAELKDATKEQKLSYFLKLNTGGRIMSEEHLDKVRKMLNENTTK